MNKTRIEWTDATWNPVSGCTKVSTGCHHCYVERQWPRLNAPGMAYAGRAFTDVACHPDRLDQPLRWVKPRRIFVNSMSDLFHEAVSFKFIDKVFTVMALASQHTFQVLTKRPDRMLKYFNSFRTVDAQRRAWYACEWAGETFQAGIASTIKIQQIPNGLPNVWLGVSIEDQATADERIPILLQTPAAVRWISAEPLLGQVDLERGGWSFLRALNPPPGNKCGWKRGLDWVVCGGESGPKARPMHPDWARALRDQCVAAGVPFLFKQWGEYMATSDWLCADRSAPRRSDGSSASVPLLRRVGRRLSGRFLDGRTWDEYPR